MLTRLQIWGCWITLPLANTGAPPTAMEDELNRVGHHLPTFLRWGANSLLGHIVLFELFGSLPLAIIIGTIEHSAGTLNFVRVVRLIVTSALFGPFCALPLWYGVTGPFLRARRDRQKQTSNQRKNDHP
jgi:hypothetical protein